ncbi:MAG: tryptophan-rich sensory protein [Verrucomicrobiae bacterium]|nr:tryptophan-rich sensory protein [Verrucomicrobiae bacterium]
MNRLTQSLPFKITLCIIVAEVLGGLGAVVTVGSLSSWYRELQAPPGTPPNQVFGPVWSTLYAMIGCAFALVWHRKGFGATAPLGRKRLAAFVSQAVLNLIWTPIFFGLHLTGWALITIVLLIAAIAVTIRLFHSSHRVAAWLMVPYLVWVCYATYLNAGFYFLNR